MEVFSNIVLNLQAPAFATVFSPQGQTLSRSIQATLMDGATPWEIPETALCIIRYAKPDGTKGFYDTLEDDSSAYSYNGNVVTFGLATQALTVPGTVLMQLDFYNSDGEKLSTFTFRLIVAEGVFADSDIASEDFINVLTAKLTEAAKVFADGEAEAQQFFDENTAEAQQIFNQIKQIYGAPWTAATAAAMTDTSRVYVYTGTTTDTLTNGHWYYWDGTAWADGGVYNSTAFETDPTLTIAGAAADAKATGDAVEDLNRQLSAELSTKNIQDITNTKQDVYGSIATDGVFDPTTSGTVAKFAISAGVYKISYTNRATPVRIGLSDTGDTSSSIALNNYQTKLSGEYIYSDGSYDYLYVYYKSTSYPSATITLEYYAPTDKTLSEPNIPADAKITGDKINDIIDALFVDITGELTDISAVITSDGVVQSNVNGKVAILKLDKTKYIFNFTGRTECRAGFSDALFTSSDLTLSETFTVSDGQIIESDGSYRYMYLYYMGTTYPDATIATKWIDTSNDVLIDQAFRDRLVMISSDGVITNATSDQAASAEIALQRGTYTFHISNRGTGCRAGFLKRIFVAGESLTLYSFRTISDGDTIYCDGEYNYLYIYYKGPSYPDTVLTVNYAKDSSYDINPLKNKTIVAIGDSLLYGFGIERNQTWLALLANEYDFTAYNYGVSGNPVAISNDDPNGMCVRIDTVLSEHPTYDYFILEGGANDMWQNVPIGDVKYLNPNYDYTEGTQYGESTTPASTYKYLPNLDKNTFCGAVNYIIKSARESCPTARILVLTNYNRKRGRTNTLGLLDEDYVDAMIECCKFMGVPYIDNYHDIGFNIVDDCMRAWADTGDQHINAAGHAWLKNIYFRKLIEI